MEKQHPLNELLGTTMERIRTLMDANTVVGAPIRTGEVTLIPVSRLSFGVASGGSDFMTKYQKPGDSNPFGGGGAASAKVEPLAFLVIRGDNVRLLPVAPPPATTIDRLIDAAPEVVDKVTDFIEKQQDKRLDRAEAEVQARSLEDELAD